MRFVGDAATSANSASQPPNKIVGNMKTIEKTRKTKKTKERIDKHSKTIEENQKNQKNLSFRDTMAPSPPPTAI